MIIKIVEPGYENFTGEMGVMMFKDAVSVDHVSRADATLLAASIRVIDFETGKHIPDAGEDVNDRHIHVAPVTFPTLAEIRAAERAAQDGSAPAQPVKVVTEKPKKIYSAEELAKIADTSGIGGLRELADPMGIKGTSIGKIINDILRAQGNAGTAESNQALQTPEE